MVASNAKGSHETGTKTVLECIIKGYYGEFLPKATTVLKYNDEPVGYCFVNLTSDKIANIPLQISVPWTEAVRISSANNTIDEDGTTCKAFAVVNRSGILTFEGDKINLSTDIVYPSSATNQLYLHL